MLRIIQPLDQKRTHLLQKSRTLFTLLQNSKCKTNSLKISWRRFDIPLEFMLVSMVQAIMDPWPLMGQGEELALQF
ncbi:hypothetical protein AD948_13620 [Acetobacter senegalensis]|uniref:Uncharacterized protein n=1 Tax=Acetobacter senegalensis TaxID=446692 RepID=A0A149TXD3_9PROT|nr:hypothetical protein AD948_13620 [Acetobacter senegalensis]